MSNHSILSIDQGTTSTRAVLFDAGGNPTGSAQVELPQIFPADGWVEHDPNQIWQDTLTVCRQVLEGGEGARAIAGIGITNQRETTVLWDRVSGEPLHNAIVWQDRRTAQMCLDLKARGLEDSIQEKTGLLLDPYFSGTKLAWLLEAVDGARARAEKGELCFGTIDSWLVYKLTGGKVHATDITNASRTMLFNIRDQVWDEEILRLLNIPASLLPEVKECCDDFGGTDEALFGPQIPISGIAGDQQAASVGQACFAPGMMKSTYGTGCFALVNTGDQLVASKNRLLSTIGYKIDGQIAYALEGSIFMAGATVQWLRDEMKFIANAQESETLARQANPDSHVIVVPAFTGLGAPYWDPQARGAILGMTRDSGAAEIVRAGIESVSCQTRDLMEAMGADMKSAGLESPSALRVDGGMVANEWFAQNLSDMIGRSVERPVITETTVLGAAYLAGLQVGFYDSLEGIAKNWQCDARFDPVMTQSEQSARYGRWRDAVGRILVRS
ncbi:MAG: glycerol kinase [Parvibaculaceae bacterium]|jgi:glycerol kinase|nr:glycerol kinase GlpK [Parvibaculaceae bacterium]